MVTTPAQIKPTTVSKNPTNNAVPATAPNQNTSYLVVKEWGLRFTIPSGLSDVRYQITNNPAPNGDGRLAIYAKPSGSDVQYRNDYMALNANGYPLYSIGNVYRSNYATQDGPGGTVAGKKLGIYYYYTAWSFSGLATGAACVGLYGGSTEALCQAENTVFRLINQGDTALLNTIELAQ